MKLKRTGGWRMGTILRGKCPGCDYEVEVKVGGAITDCRPEAVKNAMPEGVDLTNATNRGAFIWIDRCLSVCAACQKVVTGTYVCCRMPNKDEIQRFTRGCPFCGSPLRRYPQNARGVGCPICAHVIEMAPVGHWD